MQNKRIMIRQVSAAMPDMNINNGIIRLFRQQEMVYDTLPSPLSVDGTDATLFITTGWSEARLYSYNICSIYTLTR